MPVAGRLECRGKVDDLVGQGGATDRGVPRFTRYGVNRLRSVTQGDDMVVEPDEGQAVVLWCLRLPGLRRAAAAGRWSDRLERTVAQVRDGGSALDACRRFDLLPVERDDTSFRGVDPADITTAFPDPRGSRPPMTGRGEYRCPRGVCGRTDRRDDEGRPPVCALFDDEPMLPTGSPR